MRKRKDTHKDNFLHTPKKIISIYTIVHSRIFTFLCRVNCALDSLPADEADVSCQVQPRISCHIYCHLSFHISCHLSFHISCHIYCHLNLRIFCHISSHIYCHLSFYISCCQFCGTLISCT